ncbi:MAG: OadG family protein [Prevotella sp.]|nr:OadG family protein [Prevotella sp.]
MSIGITLMIVGMITVFTVLLIIIQLSNLLIRIVNRIAPEEEKKKAAKTVTTAAVTDNAVTPDVMEAIRQVVEKITKGTGLVAQVQKC